MAELAKTYQPSQIEPQVLERWNQQRAFAAEPQPGKAPYVIVIPPPNVTAQLHLGHALNNTLQDILIRWHRMMGDNTVWIPGTDHAGIATQTVVEKRVLAEQGKRRTDFQRDEFVKLIQAWKDEYEATITHQLKMMGCSCDFERQRFTMDDICAKAVREAFFRLFKDGLIYRGKRLVNWDPVTQTALADDEVEMQEVDGFFYYLKYPVVEESGQVAQWPSGPVTEQKNETSTDTTNSKSVFYITVATTRPETMLGDTAVAINPKDPRAPQLRGKFVRLPIVNRIVPIIEDEYVVLPVSMGGDEKDAKAQFATGFLKVTPAHDENDWLIGQRHHLPVINVLSPDAKISRNHGWPEAEWPDAKSRGVNHATTVDAFAHELLGLDRYAAREKVVQWFEEHGLLEEVKPYRHSVGHSYRSHAAIEPYLSDQWYVKVTDDRLRGAALRALAAHGLSEPDPTGPDADDRGDTPRLSQEKSLRFTPARYAHTFQAWHENIRDWCISRQLWWGHRIPVWSKRVRLTKDNWYDELVTSGLDHIINPGNNVLLLGNIATSKTATKHAIASDTNFGLAMLNATTGVLHDLSKDALMPVTAETEGEYVIYICCRDDQQGLLLEQDGYTQDPDVLDTWFSSALWPISTLGWPNENGNIALQHWNPSSTLCTAREIITLWVSRMVMFNLYFRGCLPFEDVFVHAMIQDGEGRKMSKSLGNGVDPLDIIASHGADALRFTLAQMTTQTQDLRMPVVKDAATGRNTSPKFDLGRNFCNKIWNATRFALSVLQEVTPQAQTSTTVQHPEMAIAELHTTNLSLVDQWILSRIAQVVSDAQSALEQYEFSRYAQGLYDFFWRDLCDWYIEAIKPTVAQNTTQRAVLLTCLDTSLRLMHPVMPFLSETLWDHLNTVFPDRAVLIQQQLQLTIQPSALLIHADWPRAGALARFADEKAQDDFELVREIIVAIRQVRTQYKVPPRQKVEISAKAPPAIAQKLLPHRDITQTLANVICGQIGPKVEKPGDAAAVRVMEVEIYLHGLVQADAEIERLQKRQAELQKSISNLQGRLKNPSYIDRAPPALVQQTKDQLAQAEKELALVEKQLQTMGA